MKELIKKQGTLIQSLSGQVEDMKNKFDERRIPQQQQQDIVHLHPIRWHINCSIASHSNKSGCSFAAHSS
jgi:hypothetical protein